MSEGTARTSMNSRSSEDCDWVIQVKKSLTDEPPHGSDQVYQRVPKLLKNEITEAFYTPQVVSFGPYHFQMKEPMLDEVEVLKSKVARKFNDLLNQRNTSLHRVARNFRLENKQAQIKKIYAKGFPSFVPPDALAWMMTRDACFLVEILNMFSEEENEEIKERSPEMEKQIPLLSIYHPLLNDIVKDMFKMENQLPLWVLDQIRKPLGMSEDDCFESALKILSPVEVVKKDGNRSQVKRVHHILYLLREYILDTSPLPRQSGLSFPPLRLGRAIQQNTSLPPPRLLPPHPPRESNTTEYIPPPSSPPTVRRILIPKIRKWTTFLFLLGILFLLSVIGYFFYPILFLLCLFLAICLVIWLTSKICISHTAEEEKNHVPTVEELSSIGVRFKKLEGRGISYINFKESSRTLYLPKFKAADSSEVILRNLVALEMFSEKEKKPITRYAIFMNDLVNTSADIAILRRHNIITNKLGSDHAVARLWNSIVIGTKIPIYEPIDSTAAKINGYRGKRCKVLGAQFMMIYCSKPWVVLSLLGATSLLLLTFVQVGCLFVDCRKK